MQTSVTIFLDANIRVTRSPSNNNALVSLLLSRLESVLSHKVSCPSNSACIDSSINLPFRMKSREGWYLSLLCLGSGHIAPYLKRHIAPVVYNLHWYQLQLLELRVCASSKGTATISSLKSALTRGSLQYGCDLAAVQASVFANSGRHSHPLGAQKLGQALEETTSWTSWIATLRTQLKVGFSSLQQAMQFWRLPSADASVMHYL